MAVTESDDACPLLLDKHDLVRRMETDPAGVAQSLGGKPFAIICPVGQITRYRKLAEYLGLEIAESKMVGRISTEDNFLVIHAGEAAKWMPGLGIKT